MTEGTKTGVLAVLTGVIALLAWTTSSRSNTLAPAKGNIGKPLFEKFTDPLAAASLKILRYDSPKEDYVEFEVARDRKTGVWTIPSHDSYPADAGKQMSEAANLFVGLKTLGIASEKRADQSLYGVLEPNKQTADQGGEGVGMLVQMRDEKGDVLADLIIGKDDANKKRFVRIPSEDVIYVVDLDTTPLSTDFKQWIEADLLKLSSNDIETLGIRDYQIITTTQGAGLSRSYEADLSFSTSNGQWQAKRIVSFESEPPTEKTLTSEEQLNASKLNDIKSALDNLRIADVIKKPAGLASDLKGNKALLSSQEALMSLQKRGFFPNPNQSKDAESVEFYSRNGELIVTLKDGVQYLLRFGGGAGVEIKDEKKSDEAEEGKNEESVSINRFLLVTTRVDESKFPQPELERIPETVDELKAIEALKKDANKPASSPTVDSVPSTETPLELAPVEGADSDAKEEKSDEAKAEESKVEAAASSNETPAASGESPPEGRPVFAQEPQETQAEPAKDQEAPAQPEAAKELTEEEWKERLDAERERITKENQRKIDQRNDKLLVAKKKVAELNGRFADWYYVVSEADFKRLKVSLPDLVQPKGPASNELPGGPGLPNFPGLPLQQ